MSYYVLFAQKGFISALITGLSPNVTEMKFSYQLVQNGFEYMNASAIVCRPYGQ